MFASNHKKPKQQLITLLEPRRLMSISGAADFVPTAAAPQQVVHSVGFEHAMGSTPQIPPQMPPLLHFAPNDDAFGGSFGTDSNMMEVQFAKAIGQGTPLFFGNQGNNQASASATDSGDHSAHVNTLTTMYSELSDSTVHSIDSASEGAATATVTTLTATDAATFRAGVDQNVGGTVAVTTGAATGMVAVNQNAVISAMSATGSASNQVGQSAAVLGSTVEPLVQVPSTVLQQAPIVSQADMPSAMPHLSLQKVEQELLTVSNLASEMISQLGRDIAIELSHLQSDLGFEGMTNPLTTHWDGWRSAAVTGAAIATIVYVQSEADREKTKSAPTFSTSLIQAVPI